MFLSFMFVHFGFISVFTDLEVNGFNSFHDSTRGRGFCAIWIGDIKICRMKTWLMILFLGVESMVLSAQNAGWTADNGDGTFTNPLMWGDWPDPDVIRVGDDFYMVSTSCLLYTSPSPRDRTRSRMPSSA